MFKTKNLKKKSLELMKMVEPRNLKKKHKILRVNLKEETSKKIRAKIITRVIDKIIQIIVKTIIITIEIETIIMMKIPSLLTSLEKIRNIKVIIKWLEKIVEHHCSQHHKKIVLESLDILRRNDKSLWNNESLKFFK